MNPFLFSVLLFTSFLACKSQQNPETQALTSIKQNLHDPLGALTGWDPTTPLAPCDWRGVFCTNNRVAELRLPRLQLRGQLSDQFASLTSLYNSFSGNLPPEISNLTNLQVLNIAQNRFSGEIPRSLPVSLKYLDLSSNTFSGSIPSSISDLAQLQLINLSYNQFSGSIPASFGQLQSLEYLWLDYNVLEGTLPSAIANCSSLVHFSANGNSLGGLIPAAIGELPKLQVVSLSENKFVGAVPTSMFCNVSVYPPSLRIVQLGFNGFSGVVGPESGDCFSVLQVLDLQENHIRGVFPFVVNTCGYVETAGCFEEFVFWCCSGGDWEFVEAGGVEDGWAWFLGVFRNLTGLETLDLGGNGLNGSLPDEVMGLNNLTTLDLSGNGFSGKIPSSFGNLLRLSTLDLSRQNLSGELPSELAGLPNLQVIALQENTLSGDVHEGFSSLSGLRYLNLSSNGFSGQIPLTFGFLKSLVVLSLSNNHISGLIPPELGNCSNLETLELESNSLTANIPGDLSRLLHLKVLDLGRNNLSGEIPNEISKCSSLSSLSLYSNHLSGSIPESLSNLSNLTSLDLSANNLSGQIPANLAQISGLVYLNVSRNNLEGEIPTLLGSRFSNPSAFADNPRLCGKPLPRNCAAIEGGNRRKRLILLIVVVVSGACMLALCCCFYTYSLLRWRKKLKQGAAGEKKRSPARPSSNGSGGRGSTDNGGPKLVMFNNKITLAETIEAARQFDEENVLSRTRYGLVFKACYTDGMVLSVRRLPDGSLDENMFRKEAEFLSKVKHRNLTVLRGYYAGAPDMRLLVYDYMPNGNLATLLQEASHQDGHVLNWPMRHLIALGIARGLAFLHTSNIVHGDVKPQSVLFDADFEAHLSDFGLDRLSIATPTEPSTSATVGTLGYVSPEAVLTGEVSKESDVYSFGIVLLELLTGKRPVMFTQDEDIVKWVKKQLQKGQITELLEPGLLELDPESSEWEEFLLGVKVGLLCTAPDPLDRPTMPDIVFMLEGCRVGPDIPSSADPTSQPSPA
ncbi:INACTIVE LEUCINE-RICH REPEAT RECEPTOR KINASE XIAO-RELATED [Salix purpurea]|uniref:non-specific serine/threonine protein kinase n=1 Tax=Salix purpurea TaxID=77065 RepID=A0A9Q0V125_SALPP|nr:INACTIVE LEUCINE-RICH REPEAT RECEPTOR KINASE XIAO-RELATED [Salix purpurea]